MGFELKTHQDIIDFTTGCAFFGTGGGGDPKVGEALLLDVLRQGKSIQIIDSSEMEEEMITICPFLMGSSGPDTLALQKARAFYGLTEKTVLNMSEAAARLLLEQTRSPLGAIIAIEVGGAATASALGTAAQLGAVTLDGDYAGGRSLPEISQFLPAIHGLNYCPLMSVDGYDNQVCILSATNSRMEERLGKLIASASYSLAGQAGLLLPYKTVKGSVEKGTLSRAFRLGQAIREAREDKRDLITCIQKTIGAELVTQGEVIHIEAEEKENTYVGELSVQDSNGHKAKVWFKNEFLQLWWDDTPFITSPDFICMVNSETGEPLLNSQIKKSDLVAIFVVRAPASLTTKEALCSLSPRYFGFDFDYVPFAKKHKKAS